MAVVLFGHQVLVKRLLDPLDKGAANLDQLWQQPLGGFESYLDAVERSLNIAEYELGSDDQARILVITDGQLSLDPKSKKVKELNNLIPELVSFLPRIILKYIWVR